MKKKTTKSSLNEPAVYCRYTEMRETSALRENPRNPNKHPQFQLERLAEIIRGNGWRQPVTVSDRSGLIVKGHGRYQAAKLAGFTQVPVEVQHYGTEAEETADLLADNRMAELAEMDNVALVGLYDELAVGEPEYLRFTGYTENEIANIRADLSGVNNKTGGGGEEDSVGDTEGIIAESQFGVIVMCTDESEQAAVYDRLVSDGYNCKVVTV